MPRTAAGCSPATTPQTRTYDNASWQPTGERDLTLTHPRCVFQVLKRHFARYTPELVERVCGIEPADFDADRAHAGGMQRPGEDDRLGVRGRLDAALDRRAAHQDGLDPADAARQHGPARRRHHGAARAREHPGRDRHPDAVPPAGRVPADAAARRGRWTRSWPGCRTPGSGATSARTWSACSRRGSATRPARRTTSASATCRRISGDHGTYRTTLDMIDRKVKGYFLLGENPAVGLGGRAAAAAGAGQPGVAGRQGPDADRVRPRSGGTRPRSRPGSWCHRADRDRGVLPAGASHVEKDGSFTNTQRLLQWHAKALEPPGDARSDLSFMYHLGKRDQGPAGLLGRPARPARCST